MEITSRCQLSVVKHVNGDNDPTSGNHITYLQMKQIIPFEEITDYPEFTTVTKHVLSCCDVREDNFLVTISQKNNTRYKCRMGNS